MVADEKINYFEGKQKMIGLYNKEIEAQMQELYNRLSEKNRRLYAGIDVLCTLWWCQLSCASFWLFM